MTTHEATKMVLGVMSDGSRHDRFLRVDENGEYFTTPDHTFLRLDGSRETPPAVEIPVDDGANDLSDEDREENALAMILALDQLVEGVV